METVNAFCSLCNGYKDCIRKTDVPPPHIAKITCNCGNWWWEKKDKSKKSKRKTAQVKTDIEYCEECLRPKIYLPSGITLHEHHVLPAPEFPEYDNDVRNRHVVCTYCHEFKEILRKLMNVKDRLKENNYHYNLTELFK